MDPKSKVDKSSPVCLPNFQPHYYNGVKNTKTGLPLCLLGGQYPQVFEAAILIPHKEDGSAKIFFCLCFPYKCLRTSSRVADCSQAYRWVSGL